MVLYYSATGNTEYIAKEIAKGLEDECVDLLSRIKNQDYTEFYSEQPYIICAPVYVCEMPRFLSKYLKKQKFLGNQKVYFIFTSGGYCGISGQLAKWMVRKKKMKYMGHGEFKMPRNYMANDSYPMLSKEEVEERILGSYQKLAPTVETIKNGEKLKARHIFLFETLITLPFNPVWSKYKLVAKDFYSTEQCVGCGMCVKRCPLNNIELKDKRPVWGNQCSHCMACIGNCPVRAIEYGNITQEKEQYNFGKYSYITENIENKKI